MTTLASALADFHFLRPWWLLLLLGLPPLLWWLARTGGAAAALTRLVDSALLPHLLDTHGRRRRWPLVLPMLAGVLVTLALAGPAWQRLPQPLYGNHAAQVVALSLSSRMLARDVTPDRMMRARYKVHDLLAANADGRNGLIAYAGEAFVVAPLTTDAHALGNLLDALAPDVMPVQGDAPAKAIERGVKLLQQGGASGGSLVLVTDAANAAAVTAARRARAVGVRVSVLGVGGTKSVPVTLPDGSLLKDANGAIVMAQRDDGGLRALAAAGGGRYVTMRADHADIQALEGELRPDSGRTAATTAQADRWRDFGPWLLLPLLPLAALAFRRGWLLLLPLVLLPLWPLPVQAAEALPGSVHPVAAPPTAQPASKPDWTDRLSALWLNADQRAARALAAGHAKRAQQLAHNPALRGAAAYRAGDYAAAAQAFAGAAGTDAAYDRGNALARQGHYENAIKAYSQALKLDPHNADAAANRKAVQDWLRKRKPQDKSHPGQGSKSSGRSGSKSTSKGAAPGNASSSPASTSSSAASASAHPAHSASAPNPAASSATKRQPATASSAAPAPVPAQPASAGRAHADTPTDAAEAARQQAQAARAGKALKAQMDRALGHKQPGNAPYALGSEPASASSADKLPESMQQALQRVPDDPGGLLRRKFQLEYQQRHGDGQGDSR